MTGSPAAQPETDLLQAVRDALTPRLAQAGASGRMAARLALLEQRGLPGPRDEAWRYAPLLRLGRQRLMPPAPRAPAATAATLELPTTPPGFTRLVMINGQVQPDVELESGASVQQDNDRGGLVDEALADNSFALLSELFSSGTTRLQVPAGSTTRWHLICVARQSGADGALCTRLRIDLGAGASLELIEEHVACEGAGVFVNHVVDASVADNARLHWQRLLPAAPDAHHIETLRLAVGQQAQAQLLTIVPGCAALRSTVVAALQGDACELNFDSVALGEGTQQLDQHVLIDHRARRSRSREVFRGLSSGRARVAFTGHNRVQSGALDADSRQSLRSLIAGPAAEAIARPQLEILTDAVQASHGATVGTLDPQMLFYLLSRGLDKDVAQSLLKWAFLQDALASVRPAALRQRVEEQLLARLHDPTLADMQS